MTAEAMISYSLYIYIRKLNINDKKYKSYQDYFFLEKEAVHPLYEYE